MDDGSRRITLEGDFLQVVETKSRLSSAARYSSKNCVRLFLFTDLLLMGRPMTELEKKRDKGKKWKMIHEPIPLRDVDMMEMPSLGGGIRYPMRSRSHHDSAKLGATEAWTGGAVLFVGAFSGTSNQVGPHDLENEGTFGFVLEGLYEEDFGSTICSRYCG